MRVTRARLLVTTTLLWAVFVGLSWTRVNPPVLLNIVGFAVLIVVPGLLSMLSLKAGQQLPFWHRFGQIIGISVLELIGWPLLGNTVLPHLHVLRPLDPKPLILQLSALYVLLAALSWFRLENLAYSISFKSLFRSWANTLMAVIPLLFVAASVLGATSLNNGGTDIITLSMLVAMSVYLVVALALRKRLHDNTLAWALYMMGLSLLLMTSLRGWYTTGHDVQREFRVFQITKDSGLWNVANFRDPFNACLSITILPTVFINLLHVRDPYVYKVFFQLIFASVPTLIFLLARRYLTSAKAFLAAVYFIAFPTYFTDMTMLNRQEIAFLFLVLMLLLVSDSRIRRNIRQMLFMAFGVGMILAHYSTTYSALFILLFVAFARPVALLLARLLGKWKLFRQSSVDVLAGVRTKTKPNITIVMVVSLAVGAFLWDSVLTNTSSGATSVVRSTFDALISGPKEDSRSQDVSYSLLAGGTLTPKQKLAGYLKNVVVKTRAQAPKGTYYSDATVDAYPIKLAPNPKVPPTAVGRWLAKYHVNIGMANDILKQTSARLLQVLVMIGIIYVLLRRRFNKQLEPEWILLALGSMVFVLLQVVLPDLSIAYGLLRAFQQSLMVLALFLVIGTFALTVHFRNKLVRFGVPTGIAVLFFLASTGAISQLTGGYQPQLHLNNNGQYYDSYYLHKSEVVATSWLQTAVRNQPHADVQSDIFTAIRINSLTGLPVQEDITPGLVERDAYVFLGYTDETKGQVTVTYNGDSLTYTYPIQFLNQQKNLIYNNGGAEIYR